MVIGKWMMQEEEGEFIKKTMIIFFSFGRKGIQTCDSWLRNDRCC